ncbi:MAG TPA: TlpA disulfide reductase family protein [Methylomirabilota bacterium]|nr:TlpA disulfide reductase family protein [Methylomirabilota bacterium]
MIARALAATALALGLLAGRADAVDDIGRLLDSLGLTALSGGRPAGFTLPAVSGGKVSLAEQQGKVVLVYFWATWCPYCRRELPVGIERISRERRGQPFTVLAVSIEEPKDLVASWVKGAGVTLPVLLDYDGAVARDYRVTATPTAFVIGRDGRLVARAAGNREWEGPAGRALLDALVAAPAK